MWKRTPAEAKSCRRLRAAFEPVARPRWVARRLRGIEPRPCAARRESGVEETQSSRGTERVRRVAVKRFLAPSPGPTSTGGKVRRDSTPLILPDTSPSRRDDRCAFAAWEIGQSGWLQHQFPILAGEILAKTVVMLLAGQLEAGALVKTPRIDQHIIGP